MPSESVSRKSTARMKLWESVPPSPSVTFRVTAWLPAAPSGGVPVSRPVAPLTISQAGVAPLFDQARTSAAPGSEAAAA